MGEAPGRRTESDRTGELHRLDEAEPLV